jgi:hypothetical protein
MSREAANAATLDRWLTDRCTMEGVDGLPLRTLLNGGPNSTRKREDCEAALEILAAHGRVRVVQLGKRRSVELNPALLDGTAEAMADADAPDIAPSRPAANGGWN